MHIKTFYRLSLTSSGVAIAGALMAAGLKFSGGQLVNNNAKEV